MEKLLNRRDKECMKIAMLKHEETFREQVYELHRLYQIQKLLMKDIGKDLHYGARVERPGEEFNVLECGVSEIEDNENDLELTLGSRSYYHKKIKAAHESAIRSDSGPSFSCSSSGSSHIKGRRMTTREELLSQQKWGLEMPVSNQDTSRLNSPPWLFQALSLNMT